MRVILALAVISLSLQATEPSAFGAGDLDSNNPYGLTESEKKIHENKKTVKKLNRTYATVKQRAEANSRDIEGLRSIVESYQNELVKFKKRLTVVESKLGITSSDNFQVVAIKDNNDSDKNDSNNINIIDEPNLDTKQGDSLIERLEKVENYAKATRDINKKNYYNVMAGIKKLARKMDNEFLTKKEANVKFDSVLKFLKNKLK